MKPYYIVVMVIVAIGMFDLGAVVCERVHFPHHEAKPSPAAAAAPMMFAQTAASGAPGTLQMTAHDASGHTRSATATYNTLSANGTTLVVDYTTDQFFCSVFGP